MYCVHINVSIPCMCVHVCIYQTGVKYIAKVFNYKYKYFEKKKTKKNKYCLQYCIIITNTEIVFKIQIQILPVQMSQISYFCDADATWC